MCKAWSGLVTKKGKIYWKMGVDSHDDLRELFKKDKDLKDDKDPPKNTFARIEIHPKNGNYVIPDGWEYLIDERIKPDWLLKKHETSAWKEWKKWYRQLNEIVDFKGLRKVKNPLLEIKPPKKIEKKHLRLLKKVVSVRSSVRSSVWDSVRSSVRSSVGSSVWASVGSSVWASVRSSVWDSVGSSVWASVGSSVWASVGSSVWDSVRSSVGSSVWANLGIYFKKIKTWKYTDKLKYTGYPFIAEVKLWKAGLVPSFNGTTWRLHGGKKAEILWQGTYKDLDKI